ncbi:division plane positioning ATPase MipZ [Pyrobaculum sp.]|uniref:division plane positioning ATPase MipZ n=1 Tax=Pyrobaculum sp. TaxID=2004705 RepID=UPI00317F3B43
MEKRISKVVVMLSDKGGVGKSTWAASLTHAFNKASGKNWAVLVDMDPSRTSTLLVSPNCHGRGSLTYISTRRVLELCTVESDGGEADVVPPGEAEEIDERAVEAYDDLIATLAEHYYIIVVDLPGVPLEYSPLIRHAAEAADMLVVVTTQDSLHMARRIRTEYPQKPVYIVLNQYVKEFGGETEARQISQSKWGYLYTICPFYGCVRAAVVERKLPTKACKEFEKCVDEAAQRILSVLHKL